MNLACQINTPNKNWVLSLSYVSSIQFPTQFHQYKPLHVEPKKTFKQNKNYFSVRSVSQSSYSPAFAVTMQGKLQSIIEPA